MKILGVDYGDKRTGIAVSDINEFLASGLYDIHPTGLHDAAAKIVKAAEETGAQKIVMGLPLNMNGTRGDRAEKAELIKQYIAEISDIPVELFDERVTTMQAHTIMNMTGTRGKKRKDRVDILSAEIILQNYLDKNH